MSVRSLNNPMRELVNGAGRRRWVACHAESGVYLGDISADQLADGLEEVARAIRGGSDHVPDFPPKLVWLVALGKGQTTEVACRFRRADQPKLDPVKGRLEIP